MVVRVETLNFFLARPVSVRVTFKLLKAELKAERQYGFSSAEFQQSREPSIFHHGTGQFRELMYVLTGRTGERNRTSSLRFTKDLIPTIP